jgi:peptidoglycan/LPS O-acetylase OafA/YrhL
MIEIAGGILLALLVILCLPLLLRGIAGLFVIGGVLLIAAFFIATEIGGTLLPVVVAVAALSAGVIGVSKILDRREANRRARFDRNWDRR